MSIFLAGRRRRKNVEALRLRRQAQEPKLRNRGSGLLSGAGFPGWGVTGGGYSPETQLKNGIQRGFMRGCALFQAFLDAFDDSTSFKSSVCCIIEIPGIAKGGSHMDVGILGRHGNGAAKCNRACADYFLGRFRRPLGADGLCVAGD